MKDKINKILSEALKNIPIFRIVKNIFNKNKTNKRGLCSNCKKNKAEAVIKGNKLCLDCIAHYKTGKHIHKRRRQKKNEKENK